MPSSAPTGTGKPPIASARPIPNSALPTSLQAAADKAKRAEDQKRMTAARRAASINVRSTPIRSAPMSMDDELRAIARRHYDLTMPAEKSAPQQRGRPFKPGKSGNPAGKPKGTRNKATLVLEAILDGDAPELMRKAVQLAKAGDGTMMRLCLERLLPPRKDRPVQFELPPVNNSADAAKAMLAIVQATAAGEITPSEAFEVSRIIESFAETLKVSELETRIEALEKKDNHI